MSQLQVNRINDDMGNAFTAVSLVMRNRIINGAMSVYQRSTGSAINNLGFGTPNYALDRWAMFGNVANKFSVHQNAGSVTPPVGFRNYLGVTSLSAHSPTGADYYRIQQRIEGFNFADLMWGTANAQTVTLSFWVRSSLTGTFGGALNNEALNRSYPFAYTISSANTWERKTLTIAGDTTGTWVGATNGTGVELVFGLSVTSTLSGTAGAWAAGSFLSVTGAVSVLGTNNATFYITGVQLEKGTQATSFEYRQHQQEVALCQRYFYIGGNAAYGYPSPNTGGFAAYQRYDFKVTLRTNATVVSTYTSLFNVSSIVASARNTDFFVDQIVSTASTNTTWAVTYTASAEL